MLYCIDLILSFNRPSIRNPYPKYFQTSWASGGHISLTFIWLFPFVYGHAVPIKFV